MKVITPELSFPSVPHPRIFVACCIGWFKPWSAARFWDMPGIRLEELSDCLGFSLKLRVPCEFSQARSLCANPYGFSLILFSLLI